VTLLLTLLIMAVIGIVAAVAAGRIGGGLDDAASSLPGRGLPPGPFTLRDVDRVRFSPALRGYRMDEVDDVVDRLVDEVRRLEDEVALLRDRRGEDAPGSLEGDGPERDWAGPERDWTGPERDWTESDEPGTHPRPRLGNGWADGYGGFRRPASTVRDDDGAGDR
jgi:DivIVA domain-containing protein